MKTCSSCNTPKDHTGFYRSSKSKDGYNSWCKTCSNNARVQSYRRNPKKTREYSLFVQNRNREHIKSYLKGHPCVDCGERDIIVLEFDHTSDNKLYDVSALVFREVSIATIDAEIAKCEVRCANCHRRITYQRRLAQSGRAAVLHTEG